MQYVVDWGLAHRTLGPISAIGVDEIQYAKGHKYLTLVYQIDSGATRLLWIGQERTFETFQGSLPCSEQNSAPISNTFAPICGSPISAWFATNARKHSTSSTVFTSSQDE